MERFDPADAVHPLVRVGAAWTWRLLVLFAGFITFCYVVGRLDTVIIPVALALLASAMLLPIVDWMQRRGVPRAAAVVIVIIASIGVVAGIMTFVVEQFVEGLPALGDQFTTSINDIQKWLADGPLHISQDQIRQASDSVVKVIQDNQAAVTSGALTTATVIGEILTGALLTLFTLIFFLYGGDQIWEFVTRLAPTSSRRRIRLAGSQGFGSLVGYVRATVAVAAADAIGIGAGLAVLGVPLALPLASLVFIGAFVPIVGAFLTGFVAVFIALVTKGFLTALITLGIVVAVMQLEGHVLQPLLLGRAVRIHPLAVVLAITVGILLAGIVGGLLAVPVVAVLNTAIRSLLADDPDEVFEELEENDPSSTTRFPAAPDSPHPGNDTLDRGSLNKPDDD
ncbi:AI-2E family transporter [Rhodococcus sp. BP-252]|uniref:AI-2E family transporter n=1 Tax=Rhodococcoides kyotonense TaxID=398843 RepID=A0A177YCB2_9NOCA|nr:MULTISPECIES: AI-2E family transporter [Rhodococcus]NIL78595.1 putative transport protein [Rhodococcus sp. B10]MBY6412943.1 AI-2E family transporter [Rhodococcus sp. BP-320]MBY6419455.1 AI-2E family transporter [Rhodococcus sp. BP-321]MBY6423863.1 AI-2E family transporter [Rhodococcus sp. BP-324]MBY6429127.1 AI-2E family transporter [Rhodococcus sp. BP-323]